MRVRTTLLPILIALALIAPFSALAQGPPDNAGQGQNAGQNAGGAGADQNRTARGPDFDPHERAQESRGGWENLSQSMREQARARAESARLFGLLDYQDGVADGRYVSFHVDVLGGMVTDYALRGENNESVTFFDEVRLQPWTGAATDPVVRGPMLRWASDDGLLVAHDNPTGQLRIRAVNGTTVTLTLADDVNATEGNASDAGEGRVWHLESGNRTARVLVGGNGTLTQDSQGMLTATLDANGTLVFLAHPATPGGLHSNAREAHAAAIAAGRLGGEISMIEVDGTPVADVIEYGDLQLIPREMDGQRAVVDVSSDNETGRMVIVNLPLSALNNGSAQQILVLLDGEELNLSMDAETLLNGTVGAEGRYHATVAGEAVQIVVSIPHFSERELVITTETSTGDGTTDGTTGGTGNGTTDGTTDGTGDGTTDGTTDGNADEPPADDADTPGPALALVLALVGAAALATRSSRRRG